MKKPAPENTRPADTAKKKGWVPFAVFLLLLLGVAGLQRASNRKASADAPYTKKFMIFHTYGRITLWAPEDVAAPLAETMIAALENLEKAINTYDPESEISQLNASAHEEPFVCSEALWKIIDAGRAAYEISNGAFDISIGPLMKLWGFYGQRKALPSEQEISDAMRLTGWDKIQMNDDEKSVHFAREGMFLDFGGIAKGYALDMCVAIAETNGCLQGMIDLGGNIACLSEPPPGRQTYTVGIRNPAATAEVLETVPMLGECIATSGNYERFFILDGQFIHHIVDPATGWPVPARASVTVIAPKGLDTDIFSTAIFVRGNPLAARFLNLSPAGRVEIITADATSADDMNIQRFNWVH